MARIQAGSTLVSQYAPPFVVSDNVAQGWELVWNSTLQAFEAVDPDANAVTSGFSGIEVASFPNSTQNVFVVPFAIDMTDFDLPADQKIVDAHYIVSTDGVKQQVDGYDATPDNASNTTIIAIDPSISVVNSNVEVVGLLASDGGSVNVFGPWDVDYTTPGTIDADYDLGFLAPTKQSVIVTLDGIKQQTSSYTLTTDATATTSVLTFPELPTLEFSSVSLSNFGESYAVDDLLTLNSGGTGTEAKITVDSIGTVLLQTEADFDGNAANGTFTAGTGYIPLEVIDLSDGTQIQVTAVGGGGDVTAFNVATRSTTGSTVDEPTLTQTGTTGAGINFDLTLGFANQSIFAASLEPNGPEDVYAGTNAYTVFPVGLGPFVVTGGTGNSATFTVVKADSPRLEVVGVLTAGETPASPVRTTNLSANSVGDSTTIGLVPSTYPYFGHATGDASTAKTLSGDEQILHFKSLAEGTNITLSSVAGDTAIRIDADAGTFDNVGSGVPISDADGSSTTVNFYRLFEGDRISLEDSGTGTANSIDINYNFGYLSGAGPTINLNAPGNEDVRLLHITHSGPVTVNLAAASSFTAGDTLTIKDGNGTGGTNNITVSPNNADEINGDNADVVLSTANAYITLYSDGTHWHIIGQG